MQEIKKAQEIKLSNSIRIVPIVDAEITLNEETHKYLVNGVEPKNQISVSSVINGIKKVEDNPYLKNGREVHKEIQEFLSLELLRWANEEKINRSRKVINPDDDDDDNHYIPLINTEALMEDECYSNQMKLLVLRTIKGVYLQYSDPKNFQFEKRLGVMVFVKNENASNSDGNSDSEFSFYLFGSIDLFVQDTNTIIEFKTSKEINSTHRHQLALYRLMLSCCYPNPSYYLAYQTLLVTLTEAELNKKRDNDLAMKYLVSRLKNNAYFGMIPENNNTTVASSVASSVASMPSLTSEGAQMIQLYREWKEQVSQAALAESRFKEYCENNNISKEVGKHCVGPLEIQNIECQRVSYDRSLIENKLPEAIETKTYIQTRYNLV